MLVYLKVTKERRHALLSRYISIKSFLQRTLSETADKLITDNQIEDIERELNEYHDRRVLNRYDIHKRFCTQATKDKISKTLKEKYKDEPKHHLFEETKRLISIGNKGKIISGATRDLISIANAGKVRTEEQKENISRGHTGLHYKKHIKVSKEKVACLT